MYPMRQQTLKKKERKHTTQENIKESFLGKRMDIPLSYNSQSEKDCTYTHTYIKTSDKYSLHQELHSQKNYTVTFQMSQNSENVAQFVFGNIAPDKKAR